jgi:hypothetical protein
MGPLVLTFMTFVLSHKYSQISNVGQIPLKRDPKRSTRFIMEAVCLFTPCKTPKLKQYSMLT